ncbi:hsp70-binding protein 1 isoform X2 [Phymastichus coffea]|nr:hsp70-binding protein 1 isoform X2 [Phymastichus coffea]XP_058792575.1 hsp70-binding protein 1 isoform X2 [Phymastichus coffea]
MDNNSKGNLGQNSSNASSNARPLSIEASRTPSANQIQVVPNQPRQPHNLQGLLKFAMEATKSEDAPTVSGFQPMDKASKDFLRKAFSSLTVNVMEELQKDLLLLQNVVDLRNEDDSSKYEDALERLADWTSSMDVANDFYKIGGFSILGLCLNSLHDGIRSKSANLIAELTQNNSFCQEKMLVAGFMPILLHMVDCDTHEQARIKALYAVSCIVRGQPDALKYIETYDGYSVLMRAIQSSVEKLQIKSAFLLSSLCNRDKGYEIKSTLIQMGLIEQLAGLLAMSNLLPETKEQLLNLLNGLTNDNYFLALRECRRPELCLRQTLKRHFQQSTVEQNLDIQDICTELLDKIFADQAADEDR